MCSDALCLCACVCVYMCLAEAIMQCLSNMCDGATELDHAHHIHGVERTFLVADIETLHAAAMRRDMHTDVSSARPCKYWMRESVAVKHRERLVKHISDDAHIKGRSQAQRARQMPARGPPCTTPACQYQ